jgi:hypothetical protein
VPILATIRRGGDPDPGDPGSDPGDPLPIPVLDARRLDWRSLDGSDLIEWSGEEWIIQSGIQGLDVPPRDVVTETVPGLPGARLREIRTGPRTVILPFFVYSQTEKVAAHLAQLARLRRMIDYRDRDYVTAEGTFDLVAAGEGAERSLRCTYIDGMEGAAGVAAGGGAFWSTFDTKLLAVDPYWRGEEWSTPIVDTGAGSPFISDTEPWPRAISGSVALGADMQVEVGGDVESPPSVEVWGPATTLHITSPQGLDITVGAIGNGQHLLIETGRRRRVLLNDAPAWGLIGDSPRWSPLPPGQALISVAATGATSSTAVRVYGTSLWETAW